MLQGTDFTKTGTGTLTLSNTNTREHQVNTYTGKTFITGGDVPENSALSPGVTEGAMVSTSGYNPDPNGTGPWLWERWHAAPSPSMFQPGLTVTTQATARWAPVAR